MTKSAMWIAALSLALHAIQPTRWPSYSPRPVEHKWERGPVEINLRLSDQEPWVADTLGVELRALAPAGTEVQFPELASLTEEFQLGRVRRLGPSLVPDGRQLWQLSFTLEVAGAGNYELPALELRYRSSAEGQWHTAATEAISLPFRSLLGDNPDQAKPQPNPGPTFWPGGPLKLRFPAAVLSALLLVAGFLVVFAIRRRHRRTAPRPISAYRKAMDALGRIDQAEWLEKMELDRFYTELSFVVRHYVEDRFGLRAPEQTTEEFLQELGTSPVLDLAQREALGRFLEQCDLVKFAQARPSPAEGRSALKAARDFVRTTRDDSALVTRPS